MMGTRRLVLAAFCMVLPHCSSEQPSTLESIATALVEPSIPAPSASVKPARPRFDSRAWFAAEGLDVNKAFDVSEPERDRILRHHFDHCRPLSLPTVNVLLCGGSDEGSDNPMIVRVTTTRIHYVRDGDLRTAQEIVSGTMPDEMPDSPFVYLAFRVDGDALVIGDGRFDSCAWYLRRLGAIQERRPEARRALITVEKICAHLGRYRWAGTRFVRTSIR